MKLNIERSVGLKVFLLVILVVIISVSATYAYYQILLNGIESTSTLSLGGSQLEIKYTGTNNITADLITPGWKDTKLFNVEVNNTTGKTVKYDINIEVVDSNFYTTAQSDKGYLQYVLKKCTSASTDTCTEELVGTSVIDVQTGTKKVTTISTTETSGTTYYALDFIYPDTGVAQSQKGTDGELVHFSGYVTLVSNTNTKTPVSFADDDWETIAANVQENKEATASIYSVGSEKEVEIDIDGDGTAESYTVRIANNSNYDCTLDSKTACGFVVEFVDIVEERAMNGVKTNVGGWPATPMYKYLNGDTSDHLTYDGTKATLYSKLPSDLRNAIIDTTVVSGHGKSDSNSEREDGNWQSIDKIYLFGRKEVYNRTLNTDAADSISRQLDYYANLGVNIDHYTDAVKYFNGTAACWWLSDACSSYSDAFYMVDIDDMAYVDYTNNINGLSPAFRIG